MKVVLAASVLAAIVVAPAVYARAPAAPSNTTAPAVVAVPAVGATLNLIPGKWSGSPTSFSYQWLRCPRTGGMENGSDCTPATGPMNAPNPLLIPETGYGFS